MEVCHLYAGAAEGGLIYEYRIICTDWSAFGYGRSVLGDFWRVLLLLAVRRYQKIGGLMMESRWVVKDPMGRPVASGTMDTMYPDEIVRGMYAAGYKTYIDGKLYRPKKEAK
jgi:hypothetical protein